MKLLLGTVVGVFVGAFAAELLRHKHPELVARVEQKARDIADSLLWEVGDEGAPALERGAAEASASAVPTE